MKRIFPEAVALDYLLIELASETRDLGELRRECDGFRHDHPHRGLLRWVLQCRVSGRLLLELGRTVWQKEPTQPTEPKPAEMNETRAS